MRLISSTASKVRIPVSEAGSEEEIVHECHDWSKLLISKMSLERRLPITKWAKNYNRSYLVRDFIAGITVGLTAIPQGIAYANVAGLQPQYGLYSTIVPCFLYILFGGCKDITLGPTAIMSLMTYPYVHQYGPAAAFFLSFLGGIVILLLTVFQLGFLVDFISMPVTVGFTAAAAFTIASSQVKNFLGLKNVNADGAIDSWVVAVKNCDQIRWADFTLGCVTMIILLLARYIKKKSSSMNIETSRQKIISRVLWLCGLSGNAFVVISGSTLAYCLTKDNMSPFLLTGNVTGGLPPFQIPPTSIGNLTTFESIKEMGSAVIAIPLISVLETIAIGKAFEKGNGVDATQEFITLGLTNLVGSFIGAMPISGSFTRSAINNSSGVKTTLGGLYTGILVLIALGYLTDIFYYIPKASLAALIITAMVFMVDFEKIGIIWKTKRSDILPFSISFFACLFFTIEYGMVAGIATDIFFILYLNARPKMRISWLTMNIHKALLIIPGQDLLFPSIGYVREKVIENSKMRNDFTFVVIDGSHIHRTDTTTAKGLSALNDDLVSQGRRLILWKWNESANRTVHNYNHENLRECFKDDDNLSKILDDFTQPDGISASQECSTASITDQNLSV